MQSGKIDTKKRDTKTSTQMMEIEMGSTLTAIPIHYKLIEKPIPEHRFHADTDSILRSLVVLWREMAKKSEDDREACLKLANEASMILDYRRDLRHKEAMEIEMTETETEKLCQNKNPVLWDMFCQITGRDVGAPNYVWQEDDVIEFIMTKMKKIEESK